MTKLFLRILEFIGKYAHFYIAGLGAFYLFTPGYATAGVWALMCAVVMHISNRFEEQAVEAHKDYEELATKYIHLLNRSVYEKIDELHK